MDDLCGAILSAFDFIDEHLYEFCMDNRITETAEKVAPNVIKGKGSIEQYPECDEEEDDYE